MKLNCKTIIITVALRTLPIIGKINLTVKKILYDLFLLSSFSFIFSSSGVFFSTSAAIIVARVSVKKGYC
jgi:hypothetical protein